MSFELILLHWKVISFLLQPWSVQASHWTWLTKLLLGGNYTWEIDHWRWGFGIHLCTQKWWLVYVVAWNSSIIKDLMFLFLWMLRFHIVITKLVETRSKPKVRGAVIFEGKQLPEKEIKFVYNLIKFPKNLIYRTEWTGLSTDGIGLNTRKV